ncbi:MAG TPA: hypothetical protein VNY84_06000, partial [Acidimicrobiales bacterium]|nr:hypothetical protein [Acidimicrobiales bacterium]
TLDRVVHRGNGSARDMLSVLDQVAAAGEAEDDLDTAVSVVEALGEHDVAGLLTAVAKACGTGRDPRRLAVEVVERLRSCFLATMAPDLVDVSDEQRAALAEAAGRLGTPALVRGMEVLGEALVNMRDAVDTRVTLEAALVRLCATDADTSVGALLERIDRLERRLAQGGAPAANPPAATPTPAPAATVTGEPSRASLGAFRRKAEPPTSIPAPVQPAPGVITDDPPTLTSGLMPDRDEITKAWGDTLLSRLEPGVRSVYRSGRWLAVEGQTAVFALPNALYLDRAEAKRRNVEEALSSFFGVQAKIKLVEDNGTIASDQPTVAHDDDVDLTASDVAEMAIAEPVPVVATAEDQVKLAFPGAEEVPTP